MALLDDALGKTRTQRMIGWASAIVVVMAAVAEEMAPKDLTMGAVPVLAVLTTALLAGRRATLGVLALAVGLRVLDGGIGDIPMDLAGVDASVYVLVALVAFLAAGALRRAAHRNPAGEPASARPGTAAPEPPSSAITAHRGLTQRERQVIEMAARGLTAKQIGDRLFIGRRTVETHLARAYEKVGVRSKKHLVAVAFDTAPQLTELGEGAAS